MNAGLKSWGLTLVFIVSGMFAINAWIEHRVVSDEIERYRILKANNDFRGACRAAESVAGVQLYHKREADWKAWTEIAKQECLLFK